MTNAIWNKRLAAIHCGIEIVTSSKPEVSSLRSSPPATYAAMPSASRSRGEDFLGHGYEQFDNAKDYRSSI
jgi:hypothetical protein